LGHFIFHRDQSPRPWSETRHKFELLKLVSDRVQIKVWSKTEV